jgi:peptidoglycan/xylan/chitin deacetylase (PgdA/CDA1 family)
MNNISRRNFVTTATAGGLGVSLLPEMAVAQTKAVNTTSYMAAYDTESPKCLAAVRKIVEVHKRYKMPATFFITGKTLEANTEEYKSLLDNPLFEVASHTWSHKMLRENPFCGPAVSLEDKRKEIFDGKAIIEKVFGRPCIGLRPGCGFEKALHGADDVLALVKEAGFKYVSSLLWGKDYSLPAMLNQPFNYQSEGYHDLWEIPGHGWHENLLKNNNKMGPARITLWPPEMPEAIPLKYVTTPEEEFAVHRIFIDKALSEKKTFVSLIWHPWSLDAFDPDMKMLELVFSHVQKMGLNATRYGDLYKSLV